jgi:excisionase family DNA binding protein
MTSDVIDPPPGSPAPPIMLTRAQAAALMQVSTRTLDRLIRCGALRCCRVGRSVRITLDDLAVYLKSSSR